MSYIKEIAGQKMQIGEYTDFKDQYEVRVKVFALEVVGLNKEHKHKTDEAYLTKLAMGLIYRLVKVGRTDLIGAVIDSLFTAGYTMAGYKAKLFKYTVLAMKEQGIPLADPMKSKQEAHKA
jgi:hypothetical protein